MLDLYPDLLFRSPLYLSKRAFRKTFLRFLPHFRGPILDIGCGKRPFQHYLGDMPYVGMDFSASYRPDVVAMAGDLPFAGESFATVFCTEVLEHVPEPMRVLNECHRVLEDDGILYLTAPMTWYLHYEPYDFYRYTKYGLKYLCGKAGFQVDRIERQGGLIMYLCVRFGEILSKTIMHKLLAPMRWIGLRSAYRVRLAALLMIPYQLTSLAAIALFDRFSTRDARNWIVLARKGAAPPSTGDEG
jgi:SAM-dependent methyltransferase